MPPRDNIIPMAAARPQGGNGSPARPAFTRRSIIANIERALRDDDFCETRHVVIDGVRAIAASRHPAGRASHRTRRGHEEWRAVVGYEGLYEVSSEGRFRSLYFEPPRLLKLGDDGNGYPVIMLSKDGNRKPFTAHRLVALAFHGEKRNCLHNEAAHLDGDRANCRAANLKWVSRRENMSHRRQHGTDDRGERHASAKLTNAQAIEIFSQRGKTRYRDLAERYGVSIRTIHSVVYRKNYASVTAPIGVAVFCVVYFAGQLLRGVL